MHTIQKKPNYLLVTFEGTVTYQDIFNAHKDELLRDDYPFLNDIWQFDNCELSVPYARYNTIMTDVLFLYPQRATRTKTAIVASSGIYRVLAEAYVEEAKILPYTIKVFMSIEEAERWLAE